MKVHIVTDSCASFVNWSAANYPITIVPNKVQIADRVFQEGLDLPAEEALRLIASTGERPIIVPPTSAEFMEVYARLSRDHDAILSIHVSRELYPTWQNARHAVQHIAGNIEIDVVDSRTICAAQGMLVRYALRAIEENANFEDVVRAVRGAVERLYSIYYVESLEFLLKNEIMSLSHTVLGSMLGIKPFLTVEEGRLSLIEKVRTRGQAVDQLVDFIAEFTDVDAVALVQTRLHQTEQSRLIQERLAAEYPGRQLPVGVYNPSLAALIGTDATGVVVLESEQDVFQDDY